jgi:hypothetical protein
LTEPERAVLDRPRDLSALLSDSFTIYRRHFWTFLAMAFVVVVPVHAVVLGIGLNQFSGGFDKNPPSQSAFVPILVQLLVVGPLVAVMALHAVQELGAGRKPRAGESIMAGLDAFAVVFWPVLITVLSMAATAITVVGPLILLVRLYFVPQLVLLERKRGVDALRASWDLTRGFSLRVAGTLLVGQVLYTLAGGLIATPVAAVARSVDSSALSLAATAIGETFAVAPIAIFAALLYFDLRSRQAALVR